MTEIITAEQSNHLMLAFLVIAPFAGLLWGLVLKKPIPGLLCGLALGVANLVMWKVYNAITDRLGLDSVKNLLVNLGLFVTVGVVAGVVVGLLTARKTRLE